MASMDYCHWKSLRCRYEPEHQHCDFHTAFLARDYTGMVQALIRTADLPVGVGVSYQFGGIEINSDEVMTFKITVVVLPDQ